LKITVLTENYAKSKGILAEHGLSLYVETENQKILFDMGQSDVFLKNAEKLGVDVGNVDFAVLSHGHYDHGGGAFTFLEKNEKAPLYVSENAFGNFFSKNGYIGLDKKLSLEKRIVLLNKETEIFKNVFLVQGNAFEMKEENFSKGLKKEIDFGMITDDFLHEQYLLINEKGKKILISGCSHRGILNIMEHFNPDVFVGGLHLSSLGYDSKKLNYIAEKLSRYNTEYYTCHCTGIEQYGALKQILKDRIQYINCGQSFEI